MHIVLIILLVILVPTVILFIVNGKKYKEALRNHPVFSGTHKERSPEVIFQYQNSDDENLRKLREQYDLDSVAGNGSEIDRIINLMRWVHKLSKHAPKPTPPKELNSLNLISLCTDGKLTLNCWFFSIILNEVYLSFGFHSRMTHILPHSNELKESHVVVSVYSTELDKWIMMDADMGGYMMNEAGEILGVIEIRQHLIDGKKLIPNSDIGGFPKFIGKWSYSWYLSKNIFKHRCQQISAFGQGSTEESQIYFELQPDNYKEELLSEPLITQKGNKIIFVNDGSKFWAKP